MDDQKNKILLAVITFNVVIMLFMVYKSFSKGLDALSFLDFVVAILLASVAAGAALAVSMMKKK